MAQIDYYVLYDTSRTGKQIFGFTKDPDLVMSELHRLYLIDPYQLNHKFSIEMSPSRPQTGYELKKV